MITSKDGGEGNGAAASASSSHAQEREQEMVTLMNKEKIQENGNTEEFTVIKLEETADKDQLAWGGGGRDGGQEGVGEESRGGVRWWGDWSLRGVGGGGGGGG